MGPRRPPRPPPPNHLLAVLVPPSLARSLARSLGRSLSLPLSLRGILNSDSRYVDTLRRLDGGLAVPATRMTQPASHWLGDRLPFVGHPFPRVRAHFPVVYQLRRVAGIQWDARRDAPAVLEFRNLRKWRRPAVLCRRPSVSPALSVISLRISVGHVGGGGGGSGGDGGRGRDDGRRPKLPSAPSDDEAARAHATLAFPPPHVRRNTRRHQKNDEEAQEWRKEQARTRARASRSLRVVCHAGAEG